MPFNRLYVILLFGVLISCKEQSLEFVSQKNPGSLTLHEDSVTLVPEEGLVYYQGRPFTGTTIAFYPNSRLSQSTDYLNGKKNGLYRKWYFDGTLSFESSYLDGKQNGFTKSWWKNGQLRSESFFANGIPHGDQKKWYKSGALFKQQNLVYGQEEGIQRSWRENGKLYNNYEAKNGRIFGLKRASLCYELDNEQIVYKQ